MNTKLHYGYEAFHYNSIHLLLPLLIQLYLGNKSYARVGKQVVNVASFLVRVDSQKHIDFALSSPFGGGRPGRVKRRNLKAASKKAGGGDDEEEE